MPFSKFPLHADLLRGVKELGFQRPTPIQEQSIPPAAAGKDLLACAMTGSGKTAAFLLPILHRVMAKPRGTTRALVLTPTRELAEQIHQTFVDLGRHTKVRSVAIYGGVGKKRQLDALQRGAEVMVACPGRLLDLAGEGHLDLTQVEVLVLDEAAGQFGQVALAPGADIDRVQLVLAAGALPQRRPRIAANPFGDIRAA